MATTSPERTAKVILEPIDLHDAAQFQELLQQRILCGWHDKPQFIESWRNEVDAGTRAIFWVIPQKLTHFDDHERWGGHIAMLNQTSPPDDELARPDKSILNISSLFIKPTYRGGGIGRAAVEELEAWARTEPYGSPSCRFITIHTLNRRYIEDDGEEWRGIWKKMGEEPPKKGTGNEDWYLRMGYMKWKEEPKYLEKLNDGSEVLLLASFLRKGL
ncbi:hypothetical protein QBC38DRAFT_491623 [Podospora fimiseda]|uniref:N-acetyltransferase domain-containing protein n=1 Tax=Podospora fimiseda TaxID=252190 RepID=A0AAN7BFJ9_9PEZI|nr:hypothetical protein QBC38DRAFT_491623 [Podospora fimiseda]